MDHDSHLMEAAMEDELRRPWDAVRYEVVVNFERAAKGGDIHCVMRVPPASDARERAGESFELGRRSLVPKF